MRSIVTMTRIIAGRAGGTRLEVPARGTRPTSEKVREAVFSSLAARIELEDARVLDLFAGSGALGLEAVSRGAEGALLVESHAGTARLARDNARRVAAAFGDRASGGGSRGVVSPRIEVVVAKAETYAKRAGASHSPDTSADDASPVVASSADRFDLVFLDPPYAFAPQKLDRLLADLAPALAPGALVVVERAARTPAPDPGGAYEPSTSRRYGDTEIHWWRRNTD